MNLRPNRLGSAFLVVLLGLQAGPAAAQQLDTLPRSQARGLPAGVGLELRLGGAYIGNLFQAPEGLPRENALTATSEVRILLPLDASRSSAWVTVGGTVYDNGFDPSVSASGGARWVGGVHLLDGQVIYRARSPRIEIGDSLGFADVIVAAGSYRIRPVRALGLEALATFDRQSYAASPQRDNRALDLGGALRYFGLGYELSPEVGAAFAARSVEDDREDYDQRTLWVTLRSNLGRDVFLSLRYRHRLRHYAVSDPSANNFGREDRRAGLTFTADIALGERWSLTGYFSFEDAESTEPARVFDTRYLWTGLTYRLR